MNATTTRRAAVGANLDALLSATGHSTVSDAIEAVVRRHDRGGFRATGVTFEPPSRIWKNDGTTATMPGFDVVRLVEEGDSGRRLVVVVDAGGEVTLGPFASFVEATDAEREYRRRRIERAKTGASACPA